uniref:Dedicator of cytokinesis 4 n=1 Tax=Taeniopygia guttata TaxID=59729 RepID=A0A674GE70_TAEGU
MAQAQGLGRRYIKAFFKGFFVAVPVTVTFLDRVACVARVEGASMQPSLNPGGREASDVVLLNHWSIRNYDVQRGDIVSLVHTKTSEQAPMTVVLCIITSVDRGSELFYCEDHHGRVKWKGPQELFSPTSKAKSALMPDQFMEGKKQTGVSYYLKILFFGHSIAKRSWWIQYHTLTCQTKFISKQC